MSSPPLEARENYLLTISLSKIVEGGARGLSSLPDSIRKAIKRRIWENIYCEPTKTTVRFNTMREWIEAYPPEGLHTKPAIIEALIRDDPALVIEFKQLMRGKLEDHGRRARRKCQCSKGTGHANRPGQYQPPKRLWL